MKEICKVTECEKDANCKGFCKSHYQNYFRGQRDIEGNIIDPNFKPRVRMKCKFPGCSKYKIQRWGMCNRHRKWAEKGIIDKDTCKILKPEKVPKEKLKVCKVRNCDRKDMKGHGFCRTHYASWKIYKVLDYNGERLRPIVRYGPDYRCPVLGCDNKGPFKKGFCKFHYGQFTAGIIDFDGVKAREFKKVPKYRKHQTCKVKSCSNKPAARGFCSKHRYQQQQGYLDEKGNYLKEPPTRGQKVCKEKECKGQHYARGLCQLHYWRLKTGYKPPEERYKNKYQTCTAMGCESEAYVRGKCVKHYYRWKRKRELGLVPE